MWSELPGWEWRGPTVNQGGPMVKHRGVVVHIAEGFYTGTISWCRNPDSGVSAHFIVARDGRIAQMVPVGTAAWTQKNGNGHWLSIENEGFTRAHPLHRPGWEYLTPEQIDANAEILAKAHTVYGVPLRTTSTPAERGLGHHSMGAETGADWGHDDCPGPQIIAQKPAIVAAAQALLAPVPGGEEGDMLPYMTLKHKDYPHVIALFGSGGARWIGPAENTELRNRGIPQRTTAYADEFARLAAIADISPWPPAKA